MRLQPSLLASSGIEVRWATENETIKSSISVYRVEILVKTILFFEMLVCSFLSI